MPTPPAPLRYEIRYEPCRAPSSCQPLGTWLLGNGRGRTDREAREGPLPGHPGARAASPLRLVGASRYRGGPATDRGAHGRVPRRRPDGGSTRCPPTADLGRVRLRALKRARDGARAAGTRRGRRRRGPCPSARVRGMAADLPGGAIPALREDPGAAGPGRVVGVADHAHRGCQALQPAGLAQRGHRNSAGRSGRRCAGRALRRCGMVRRGSRRASTKEAQGSSTGSSRRAGLLIARAHDDATDRRQVASQTVDEGGQGRAFDSHSRAGEPARCQSSRITPAWCTPRRSHRAARERAAA